MKARQYKLKNPYVDVYQYDGTEEMAEWLQEKFWKFTIEYGEGYSCEEENDDWCLEFSQNNGIDYLYGGEYIIISEDEWGKKTINVMSEEHFNKMYEKSY